METVIKVVGTAGVGFICGKTLKAFGKKDCGEIINGVTMLACGVLIVGGVKEGWDWLSNTDVVKGIDSTLDGIAWVIAKIAELGSGIQDTLGDGILGKGLKGVMERGLK